MDIALEPPKTPSISGRMIGISLLIILLLASAGVYAYVYTQRPDIIKQVLLKVNDFGLVETRTAEDLDRIDQINQLSISYEEKQVLINRTIFMGASPRMVMLAIGKPKSGHKVVNDHTGRESVILVYHLPKELSPTILQFDEGKLSKAEKGSSIDYAEIPVPFTDQSN